MATDDKTQVMTRLNDEEHKQLQDAAELLGIKKTVFVRETVRSVIREYNETGKLPEWLERQLAP